MNYQKYPTSKQLVLDLKSGKLEKIYLFLGEEEGEKDKLINKIIDISAKNSEDVEKENEEYSVRRFHLENDELFQATEFAISGSMFSERKICILLNINSLRSKTENKSLMSDLLNTIPDSNILIMTSPENRVPPAINAKDLTKIKIFQFWRHFENDILSYIIESIKKKGLDIQREAINNLIDFTGRDIKKIDEAIEILTSSGEKKITGEIIREYLYDNKDVTVFEFVDTFYRKDKNAFYQLAKLLDDGVHQLVILKLLIKQAELIEKYIYLMNNGSTSDAAVQEIGVDPRHRKNFIDNAKNYSSGSIKKIFPLVFKAEERLKSRSISNNLASDPIFELIADMHSASAL